MDITGVTQNTQPASEIFNAGKLAESPPVKKSDNVQGQVQIPAVDEVDLKRAEERRMAEIRKTVEREAFKETFAVRDNRFTIFKDTSGQIITRFTSLRDGSVTYVPEPEILRFNGGTNYFQANV